MRWAARQIQGRRGAYLCKRGVRAGGRGDGSLTMKCIRILTFKIAIRNHFSTHCCFNAGELRFQAEK